MVYSSRRLRVLTLLVLTALFASAAVGAASYAASSHGGPSGVTPQGLPTLPVFRFAAPSIGGQNNTSPLAGRFGGLSDQSAAFEESYLGRPRFTVPSTSTTSLLTQYGATGGFYAYNVAQIGDGSVRGAVDLAEAQRLACRFLTDNTFINNTGNLLRGDGQTLQGANTPNTDGCVSTQVLSQYDATLVRSTGIGSAPGSQQDAEKILGVVVRVPIQIQAGQFLTPLSGPGGHVSLFLRTTNANDTGPTLDRSVPGLAAVSMPFFDRSFSFVRDVVSVDPATTRAAVEQNVRDAYPTASSVEVITPTMSYWVGDAAEEQTVFEPVLTFSGIQVVVDGETIILKDVIVPALQSGAGGFGPSVSITNPATGSKYTPGANVTISGAIADGTAPYTYQWLLDDGTPLSSEAALAAAGNVSVQTNLLPAASKNGIVKTVSVILRVTDGDGAKRDAVISLTPKSAPMMSLPLILLRSGPSTPLKAAAPALQAPVRFAVNYSFGIESASDYPPFGVSNPGDLPGVPPDANGMRNGLSSYGWSTRFFWADANVWEKDFRDCSLGGGDCSYGVDRADLVYYSGHSGAGGISVPNPSRDSSWFAAENARYSTIRWLMLSSCQALRVSFIAAPNEPIRRWFNAFQGASMILGFNSNMGDVAFGPRLFDNMRIPTFLGIIEFPWAQLSIRDAWVKTAFDMNAGKPAYLWATSATYDPANNKLPKGSDALLPRPLPVNHYYWVWWDCARADCRS